MNLWILTILYLKMQLLTVYSSNPNDFIVSHKSNWYCSALNDARQTLFGIDTQETQESFLQKCYQEMCPLVYFQTEKGRKETLESITHYIREIYQENGLPYMKTLQLINTLGGMGYDMNAVSDMCKGMPEYCHSPYKVPLVIDKWNTINSGKFNFYPCAEEFHTMDNNEEYEIAVKLCNWSKSNENRCSCKDGFQLHRYFDRMSVIKQEEHVYDEEYYQFFANICSVGTRWWNDSQLKSTLETAVQYNETYIVVNFLHQAYPIATVFVPGEYPNWNAYDLLSYANYFTARFDSVEKAFEFLRVSLNNGYSLKDFREIFSMTNDKLWPRNILDYSRIVLIEYGFQYSRNKKNYLDHLKANIKFYEEHYAINT